MVSSGRSPYELLCALERRGREHIIGLPVQDEARAEWVGIGFRLGQYRFVASMGEVAEILTYPVLSQIPRTKSWMKGIANVRGTLLPIMDLNDYLGRRPVALTRLSRVLVIHDDELTSGLLIDEVLGMRHFYEEQRTPLPADIDDALRPYLAGGYRNDDGVWFVFSMKALARHPQFLKAAS